MKHFLFTGGGTLGSLSPLLAVAERVMERLPDAVCDFVVGPEENEHAVVAAAGFRSSVLRTGKLRRYFSFRTLGDPVLTFAAFFRSLGLVRTSAPDAVMTAGSYVSVPVVWAARSLGIPVLVHQQDLRQGLANKLMVPCASVLTAAFPESAQRLRRNGTVRVTGNPIRKRLLKGNGEAARRRYCFTDGRPVVVILGGSTGAAALNELTVAAKEKILPHASILHIVGKRGTVIAQPGYVAVAFLDEGFSDALALAQVVVTRAGLATLAELAALKKPTIIVPMPDSHQEENAAYFHAHEAAVVLHQETTTASSFSSALRDLLGDESARRRLSNAIGAMHPPNARDALATELIRLASRRP